ncbi:DUF2784 domain-containing protein [Massilia sp. Se16.2.3]|uniref:DUF2784 domain-containing protein n=1 Tax=Massilia sp. Se16.2.3 TaxID=2709303 RepID=UPI0015FF8777|nr:DUF2784 domain-containing protein [Massilia sp. Se16.2.3]QNA99951.1 DUF2784 domain-containing protein [Massilia sp. Se16.2.3]
MMAAPGAALVPVLHAAFVLFVALGAFLVLRRPHLARLHLPAAAWGVLIELNGWICPLTTIENDLRLRAGLDGYGGGFVEHYLLSLLYPGGLTRTHQLVLAALVLAVNGALYWRLWSQRRRRQRA